MTGAPPEEVRPDIELDSDYLKPMKFELSNFGASDEPLTLPNLTLQNCPLTVIYDDSLTATSNMLIHLSRATVFRDPDHDQIQRASRCVSDTRRGQTAFRSYASHNR